MSSSGFLHRTGQRASPELSALYFVETIGAQPERRRAWDDRWTAFFCKSGPESRDSGGVGRGRDPIEGLVEREARFPSRRAHELLGRADERGGRPGLEHDLAADSETFREPARQLGAPDRAARAHVERLVASAAEGA